MLTSDINFPLCINALLFIVSLAVCDSAHNTGGVTVKILSTEKYLHSFGMPSLGPSNNMFEQFKS